MSNELRAMTRQFVEGSAFQQAIAAVERDPYHFPTDFWRRCVEIGGLAMDIPEEYGGGLLDPVDQAAIMEELARGHAGLSLSVLVQNSLTAFPINQFGSEEQKQKYLPRMAQGELVACFGLSEPARGSDAKGIQLTARKDEERGGWRLNGIKRWITNADRAGVIVLATRTGTTESRGDGITVFLAEIGPDVEGLSVPKPHDKIGQFGSTLCDVIFENVHVPDGAIMGEVDAGWEIINSTLEHSRVWIAAQGSGIALAALDEAEAYTAERVQFGRPLKDMPPVANHLAVMRRQVELAQFLVNKAARHESEGDELAFVWASLAKLIASETCLFVASDAMLLHGGTGYVNDLPISRIYRDSGVLRIYEGAAHIQVRIIERYLERDRIMALFPPSAGLMRDASELTPLETLTAEIETWQPGLLAVR
ncbi:MAG: acyl-CoA dehydrogenase family protein [Chloroflexia bacterium]|nr:acyl-CoA dehydrogenase family protein [Chloroflexia bacterium]